MGPSSEESGIGGGGGGGATVVTGVGEEGIMIETCGAAAICIGTIATVGTIGEGPGQQKNIPCGCGEAKPHPGGGKATPMWLCEGKAYPILILFILEGG